MAAYFHVQVLAYPRDGRALMAAYDCSVLRLLSAARLPGRCSAVPGRLRFLEPILK
jgi:hypothetical protein